MSSHLDPEKRHDFKLIFEVTDGNPNGDPDSGNHPRQDPETGQGLVTDVCLKRKIRDYAALVAEMTENPALKIYMERGSELNLQNKRAYVNFDEKPADKTSRETQEKMAAWMCQEFFDVRMMGAVMTTKVNCGQVRGPLQLNAFARSVDPISPITAAITRVARSEAALAKNEVSGPKDHLVHTDGTMGEKHAIRYALYTIDGYFNCFLAKRTGVSEEDLKLIMDALAGRMFEQDRSAAKGRMATRALHVWTHDDPLGNASAHGLLDRVTVHRKVDTPAEVCSFSDYEVRVDLDALPAGVTHTSVAY